MHFQCALQNLSSLPVMFCCSVVPCFSRTVILVLTLANLEKITQREAAYFTTRRLVCFPGSPFGATGISFWHMRSLPGPKYLTTWRPFVKAGHTLLDCLKVCWSHPSIFLCLDLFHHSFFLLFCHVPHSSSPSILHAFHSCLRLCCPICLASFLQCLERGILTSLPHPSFCPS